MILLKATFALAYRGDLDPREKSGSRTSLLWERARKRERAKEVEIEEREARDRKREKEKRQNDCPTLDPVINRWVTSFQGWYLVFIICRWIFEGRATSSATIKHLRYLKNVCLLKRSSCSFVCIHMSRVIAINRNFRPKLSDQMAR